MLGNDYGSYLGTVTPNIGDLSTLDQSKLEFRSAPFYPGTDGNAIGTFDLSQDGDGNYATCSRCLSVIQDPNTADQKQFFQVAGTMVVGPASEATGGYLHITLDDVTLVEVTIDPNTLTSTPVPGGDCVHFASTAISAGGVPLDWTCGDTSYGTGDGCDCGCGAVDPDCVSASADACDYCDGGGSCGDAACPGNIDFSDNATCD